MNRLHGCSGEEVCRAVRQDIDLFVGTAPQFDDITMLYLKYNGGTKHA
ncbi:protein serine/threonine phosphatase [Clostridium sp. CAG:448]|nr:protein serine/threonine phosphatase [Clostridium sp. CAG:448]